MYLKKWTLLERSREFKSRFVEIYKDRIKLPDGSILEDFFLVKRKDYVIIVATDSKGRFITLRQYRHGSARFELELPGGHVEPGEKVTYTARRELEEETGFTANKFEYLGNLSEDPSGSKRNGYIVRAKNAKKISNMKMKIDKNVEVVLCEPEKLDLQIKQGRWKNSPALAALMLAEKIE